MFGFCFLLPVSAAPTRPVWPTGSHDGLLSTEQWGRSLQSVSQSKLPLLQPQETSHVPESEHKPAPTRPEAVGRVPQVWTQSEMRLWEVWRGLQGITPLRGSGSSIAQSERSSFDGWQEKARPMLQRSLKLGWPFRALSTTLSLQVAGCTQAGGLNSGRRFPLSRCSWTLLHWSPSASRLSSRAWRSKRLGPRGVFGQ